MITINLDKAKDITKVRLRLEAQESGSNVEDTIKNVDTCTTTDELKALSCTKPE